MPRTLTKDFLINKAARILPDAGFRVGPAWIKNADGVFRGNVGVCHVHCEGRRYQVVRMANEAGGESMVTPTWERLTANELNLWLDGVEAATRSLGATLVAKD